MASVLIEGEPEEPDGALETGLWCRRCFLPSGIKWPALTVFGQRIPGGYFVICHDCNGVLDDDGIVVSEAGG